jgi:predicted acylesterase/phospholipase RssA
MVVKMGHEQHMTLQEFFDKTGKQLDVYVTNLSKKRVECWNYKNHPCLELAMALTVSSCIPLLMTAPVLGDMYGDGGIMQNVPISS